MFRHFSLVAAVAGLGLSGAVMAEEAFVPLVDHHQHLLSPAGVEQTTHPISPAIALSPELGAVLDRRVQIASLDDARNLYTSDAVFLDDSKGGGWINGPAGIATFLKERFRPGYRVTPTKLQRTADTATIAGYYSREAGGTVRHVGYTVLNLVRVGQEWKIASEIPSFPGPWIEPVVNAATLIKLLDQAGIERALVLSDAYYFDRTPADWAQGAARVRAENEWTASEVAKYPDRLVAFCSVNPLAPHAVRELEWCASSRKFRGVKFHLASSGVDLEQTAHARKLRAAFTKVNALRLPIMVHLGTGPGYGRAKAEAFVRDVLPAAPDVPVVINHLWGGSAYSDEALTVYSDAVVRRLPAASNLYFELAQVSMTANEADLRRAVAHMRAIGLERIYYGSDGPQFNGLPPKDVRNDFRAKMPLTPEEFRQIAGNVAPFMRSAPKAPATR